MLKNFKVFVSGFLIAVLLTVAIASIYATTNETTVQALLNSTLKLKLNGQDWAPKDPVSGDYYKALSYNGRTYLPLRAVVEEAAKMPVDFDAATQTVWIGGKSDIVQIKEPKLYEDYYGTVLSLDSEKLSTPVTSYKWGVTNDKPVTMQHFTCFLKPNANYKRFRASFFLDDSAKGSLPLNIRKDKPDGIVLKTLTLKPGETQTNIDIDIGGMEKICLESNVNSQGTISKIIIGEPIFYNGTLPEASPNTNTSVRNPN